MVGARGGEGRGRQRRREGAWKDGSGWSEWRRGEGKAEEEGGIVEAQEGGGRRHEWDNVAGCASARR